MVRSLDSHVGYLGWQRRSVARVLPPNAALNTDAGGRRDNSADSRVYGFIPRDEIVGNARTVVVSLDYDHYYIPRVDRFFHGL